MSNFKDFQRTILSLSGVWKNESSVYFSQMKDGYSAAYKPNYPKGSTRDMIIQTIDKSGAYRRGNYELMIFLDNKYQSIYFQNIAQLREYFKKQ